MAIIRAPKKSKWYVVWVGHAPGIYPSWEKCRPQVEGYQGSRYRAYDTLAEARVAFEAGPPKFGGQKAESGSDVITDGNGNVSKPATRKSSSRKKSAGPITPSVSVDAACNMETRVMEYRGVDTETGKELFRMGPYQGATNNMGEFLAIVHALSLLTKEGNPVPVYTDSKTALTWLRNRKAKVSVERSPANKKVFELIERAEQWLKQHSYSNQVLKWETDNWGENPADFGRK